MSVETYTADANSLLFFIADVLPAPADDIYTAALAGEATILVPPIAAAETAYILNSREEINGIPIRATDEDFVRALDNFLPVTVSKTDVDDIRAMLNWTDIFPKQIHDALVLANHEARETKAIITSDQKMRELQAVETVWKETD